jgi:hypothetical protein
MVQPLARLHLRAFLTAALVLFALAAVTPAASQECALTLTSSQVPVEQLTLADFDIQHFESRGLIFSVNISNPGPAPADVQMDIVLKIELTDDHKFLPAAVLRTNPFTVPVNGRTITNLNLGQSKDISFESFEVIPEARDEIEKRTLSTGIFPAGRYTFDFSLAGACSGVTPVDVVILIGNPSRLELIAPRDGEEVSQYPVFEFFHEGRSARLTVAELRPGQTYEDAIDRNPAMLEKDLSTERTVVYSGGRLLEQGKSYVWRVQTLTTIAGGSTVDVSSPVYGFTVAEGGTFEDALLARLERMYGRQYPGVFKAIRDGRFSPTGSFSLEGKSLSGADLAKLLDQLEEAIDSSELTFE